MWPTLLALALLAEPGAAAAAGTGGATPLPLPVPRDLGTPFAAPAAPVEPAPAEVTALLAPGRKLVEARQADLDLDGAPEWILVASFQHPERADYGPASLEWRPGQRIESKASHELVIVGRERGAPKVRYTAELRGSERQELFVERLAAADLKPGRFPVVITGARACAGTCGPMELHLVIWDPKARALGDYAWVGAEVAALTPRGTVEAWFADRRAGDPICCPSAYTVMELAAFGVEIDVRAQRTVAADQFRRLVLPGKLIFRADPPAKP